MKALRQLSLFSLCLLLLCIRGWGDWALPPNDLSTLSASFPRPCFSKSGTGFVVWTETDGSNFRTRGSFFNGTSWSPAQNLSPAGNNSFNPRISCDDLGNAIAIWRLSLSPTNAVIQISRFVAGGSTWSMAETISPTDQNLTTPSICATNFDFPFVVWIQLPTSVVQASNFNGSFWTIPVTLSLPGLAAFEPQICCDGSGNAFAIWSGSNGTNNLIQADHYNGSWGHREILSQPGTNYAFAQICCDEDDNAIAIWTTDVVSNNVAQSSRFINGSWISLGNVSTGSQNNARLTRISCGANGTAHAIWLGSDGINNIIQTAAFNGISWGPQQDLSLSGQNALSGDICADDLTHAVAVWNRSNGSNFIVQSSYLSGSTWSVAQDLSLPGANSLAPLIACDGTGNAIATWFRANVVQATFFLGPVLNFRGCIQTHRSATQTANSSALSWTTSAESLVAYYKVLRNDKLIVTLPASQGGYRDCRISLCNPLLYSIIKVNAQGNESPPSSRFLNKSSL